MNVFDYIAVTSGVLIIAVFLWLSVTIGWQTKRRKERRMPEKPICKDGGNGQPCPHFKIAEHSPSGEERCTFFPGGGMPDRPLRIYPVACMGHPTKKPTGSARI